ncbi:MAG: tetratricopeptide repeat protein [Paracoccaceae bacterium]
MTRYYDLRATMRGLALVGLILASLTVPGRPATFEIDPDTTAGRQNLSEGIVTAGQAINSGKFRIAAEAARAETQKRPNDPLAWHLYGIALANLDQVQPAIEALKVAASFYQENAEPFIIIGELHLLQGDRAAAREVFEQATTRDPSDWRGHESLGRLADDANDIAAAIGHFTQATRTMPDTQWPVRARLAALLRATDQPDKALDVLKGADAATQPMLATETARTLVTLDKAADAIDHLRAATTEPDAPNDARLLLGELLASTGDLTGAEEAYRDLVAAAPDSPLSYQRYASALAAQARYDAASTQFALGLDKAPQSFDLLRGATVNEVRRGDLNAATTLATRLADAHDQSASAHMMLAWVHEQAERPQAAEAAYGAALNADPENAGALNNLAALFVKQDRAEEALPLARKAVEVAPEMAFAWHTLGEARLALGDSAQASADLAQAVNLRPGHAVYLFDLGVALTQAGQTDAGRKSLQDSLALGLDAERAERAEALLSQ